MFKNQNSHFATRLGHSVAFLEICFAFAVIYIFLHRSGMLYESLKTIAS